MALSAAAVLAAIAVAAPAVPHLQALTSTYRGVARVALPNFTRVQLPETPAPQETSGVVDTPETDAPVIEEIDPEQSPPALVAGAAARNPTLAQAGANGIIPVRFDLETPGSGDEVVGGDEIIVRKAVRLAGREIGSLPIHVDSRSRLLVRPSDLKSVLEKAGQGGKIRGSGSKDELRSFAELRKDGLDLRYDPAGDIVVITIG